MENHESVIVTKPWGYEYLAYRNKDVAVWFLHIDAGERTSMHCHPSKSTGLVILSGQAKINFIADSKILSAPSKQMIRRGLFHQTEAISEQGVDLLEIETPVDKNDLVRLKDSYGRKETGYEKEKHQFPKTNDCLWFEDPNPNESFFYKVLDTTLTIQHPTSLDFFNNKNDSDILMFLSGGLYKTVEDRNHSVVIPGDVGYANIVKEVSKEMSGLLSNTKVVTIK